MHNINHYWSLYTEPSWGVMTSYNVSILLGSTKVGDVKLQPIKSPSLLYLVASNGLDGQYTRLTGLQWVRGMSGHFSQWGSALICINLLFGFVPDSFSHSHSTNTCQGTVNLDKSNWLFFSRALQLSFTWWVHEMQVHFLNDAVTCFCAENRVSVCPVIDIGPNWCVHEVMQ